METNPQLPARLNLGALLLGSGAAGVVALRGGSAAGAATALLLASGAWVAALSAGQLALRAREARERDELGELNRRGREGALFEAKPESLHAAQARVQFDRVLVPAFTVLLLAAQGAAGWWFWRRWEKFSAPAEPATWLMVVFSLLALLCFVLGKYSASLARQEPARLLRPGASHLLWGALAAALTAGAAGANYFGMPRVDRHAAHAILGLLALVGVETVVNLVLEIYRPRTRGAAVRPLYESRLLGLFSQPGGLLRTAAHTLDYQFGFKVSGTWFYRYLERALAGLVLAQLAVVWLSTCLVLIEPHEDALLERWGRPVAARPVLGPGLHFKGPWPMDRALVFSSRELKSFNVGFTPDPELEKRDTLLWTRAHYKEELNLLVASRDATDAGAAAGEQTVPVNLITVSIPVQYRVTNLLEWAVGHAEGERLLPLLATREVAHYLVSVDLEEFMAAGRGRAAEELRAVIQRRANEARLGVEILFVGLQDVHPPVPVADAYEAVIAATQERETRVLDAQGYRAERLPRAQAEADRRILEQRGASVARISRAAAQAARFTNQIAAAHAAPAVFNTWTYHDTLTRALSGPRKFVIATTNSHQQFWLNLEDKLRPDLLDVPIPPAKEEKK